MRIKNLLARSEKKFGFNVSGDSPKKSKSQSCDSVVNFVLVGAKNLDGKDSNGLSDPYVKFQLGNKEKYKSKIIPKTLNPVWNERFSLHTFPNQSKILELVVYDHNYQGSDEFMGKALIDLAQYKLEENHRLWTGLDGGRGSVCLMFTILGAPSSSNSNSGSLPDISKPSFDTLVSEKIKSQYHSLWRTFSNSHETVFPEPKDLGTESALVPQDTSSPGKKIKTQQWDSVVNIVLIEGKNLDSKDDNGLSDPYVKFQIGKDRYKSKVIPKTLNPVWNERFSLYTFPNQGKILEISVYDRDYQGRDDFMGKASINLENYKQEETHKICTTLEGGQGEICLMFTISGTSGSEALSDMSKPDDSLLSDKIVKQYSLWRTFNRIHDVGFLELKVFRAEGLLAADMNGKSDPFCVIELVNTRVQTNTEYKTLSPQWNKIFTFNVRDVHEILEVTVYDEDRDRKVDFLGKVAIPLLKIQNGEKKWYYLKDRKLRKRTKGRILLEMNLIFNKLRAYIRTFNPRETKVICEANKFKPTLFVRNVNRVRNLVTEFCKIAAWINSCFNWESKLRSITTFILFLVIVYFFELYMAPLALLIIFFAYYVWNHLSSYFGASSSEENRMDLSFDADDEEEKETEEKKGLMERFQGVSEVSATVQATLGMIASYMERVKNSFNFSVPFLSWLAVFVLTIVTLILYFIPLRYLIMAWGVNKFTKKLRNPNYISNNELLDYLSRVPDIDELIMYQETIEDPNQSPSIDSGRRKEKKKQ